MVSYGLFIVLCCVFFYFSKNTASWVLPSDIDDRDCPS